MSQRAKRGFKEGSGDGDFYIKMTGMLVVLLVGVQITDFGLT